METSTEPGIFEVAAEAGIEPKTARKLERAIESAIDKKTQAMLAQLMTKADGALFELRLLMAINDKFEAMNERFAAVDKQFTGVYKAINEQTRFFIAVNSFIFTVVLALIGVLKVFAT